MLKKEQIEFYNLNGYLILKDYIDLKDLQELKNSFHFLVDSFLNEKNSDLKNAINKLEKINHSKLYLCQKIIASSSKAIKLISNLNIDEIYSKIYSVEKDNVHLQPMQTPVQFPNDDRFDFKWHQESGSFKGFSKKILTCWFPVFSKVNKINGSVCVIPKSHLSPNRATDFFVHKSGLRDWFIPNITKAEEKESVVAELELGDMLIFDSECVHKSVANQSDIMRITGIVRALDISSRENIRPIVQEADLGIPAS